MPTPPSPPPPRSGRPCCPSWRGPPMALSDHPRYPLLFGPSPVHRLDRLTEHLGGAAVWAKREDVNSGIAFGGNKTRKLEYLVAEALAQGCDTLVSIGGGQANPPRPGGAPPARRRPRGDPRRPPPPVRPTIPSAASASPAGRWRWPRRRPSSASSSTPSSSAPSPDRRRPGWSPASRWRRGRAPGRGGGGGATPPRSRARPP